MPDIRKNTEAHLVPVIAITEHKGVIFGYMDPSDIEKRSFPMKKTKVAMTWGTKHGVNDLAHTGPTSDSLISAEADAPIVHDVIKILEVKPDAVFAWQRA